MTAPTSTSARTTSRAWCAPRRSSIGRNVKDVLPPELAEQVLACVGRALDTGAHEARSSTSSRSRGVPRWKESRMVPSGGDEVVTIVRDFTEQRRAEAEQRRLADEQAALRRVATLVAGDPPPEQVFQAVTEEVCGLLGLRTAVLHRFEDATTSTIVGKFGDPTGAFEPGNEIHARGGHGARGAPDGRARALRLRQAHGPGRGRAARAGLSLERRRPDQRRRRHVGRAGRGAARRGDAPGRDRAPRCRSSPSSSRSRSRARRRATSSPPRGSASSRRATPSGAGSSATSTTAPSSGSSRSRSGCDSPRRGSAALPDEAERAARGRRRRAARRR